MVYYLSHSGIDKIKWNRCIEQSVYPIIYGYSWYLDVISPGWDALVEDDYQSVFPLTWKKKFGIHYLTQPFFAQQLGIFSRAELTQQKLRSFFNAIPKKFAHYDIMLNPHNIFPMNGKLHSDLRKTYHVPLHDGYDNIYAKFSGDTKRNLRISSKKNLEVMHVDASKVIDLYKKNVWYKTPVLKQCNYNTLLKLVHEIKTMHPGQCLTLGVNEAGQLCAGGIFLISNGKIIFLFGAASPTGRKNAAMRHLFDQVIKKHCRKNFVLDFEGSSVKTVEYFYKSFGSEKITFPYVHYTRFNALRYSIRIKQKLTRLISKILLRLVVLSASPHGKFLITE